MARGMYPGERDMIETLGRMDACQDVGVSRMVHEGAFLSAPVRHKGRDGTIRKGTVRLYRSGMIVLLMEDGMPGGSLDKGAGTKALERLLATRVRGEGMTRKTRPRETHLSLF